MISPTASRIEIDNLLIKCNYYQLHPTIIGISYRYFMRCTIFNHRPPVASELDIELRYILRLARRVSDPFLQDGPRQDGVTVGGTGRIQRHIVGPKTRTH